MAEVHFVPQQVLVEFLLRVMKEADLDPSRPFHLRRMTNDRTPIRSALEDSRLIFLHHTPELAETYRHWFGERVETLLDIAEPAVMATYMPAVVDAVQRKSVAFCSFFGQGSTVEEVWWIEID